MYRLLIILLLFSCKKESNEEIFWNKVNKEGVEIVGTMVMDYRLPKVNNPLFLGSISQLTVKFKDGTTAQIPLKSVFIKNSQLSWLRTNLKDAEEFLPLIKGYYVDGKHFVNPKLCSHCIIADRYYGSIPPYLALLIQEGYFSEGKYKEVYPQLISEEGLHIATLHFQYIHNKPSKINIVWRYRVDKSPPGGG